MKTLILILTLLLCSCTIRVYEISYTMHDGNHVSFECLIDAEVPKKIDTQVDAAATLKPLPLPK
jgi:hypothetical protein